MTCRAMKIADGIQMLELPTSPFGRDGILNPVFIWDDNSAILIDAGLPGQVPLIKEGIERTGIPFKNLTKIIITHQDLDHIGSLSAIQNELGENLNVLAHIEEKPYIEFKKRPIKMTPESMAQLGTGMAGNNPLSEKELMRALKSKVGAVVDDGDEFEECGGITIIYTPGHTPGHISLYLKKYKILVAGDALNLVNGELLGPHPRLSHDINQAKKSLKRVVEYDIEAVICYHGGLFRGNVKEKIFILAN